MDFNLTKEQELLRDGLGKFLSSRYTLETSRAAAKTGIGWQPEIWRAFADDLGILGATLPEDAGGTGGGPVETMVIAEALGHALVVEPFVDTVVVAGGLLHRAGARSLLEQVVAGAAVVALAATETTSGENWRDVATTARRDGDQWVLNGAKIMVLNAPLATHLLITARTSGDRADPDGISLFVIQTDQVASGFAAHEYRTVDDRRAADLDFTDLRLPADALLGAEGQAWASSSAPATKALPQCAPKPSGACARCSPTRSNTANNANSSASRSGASKPCSTAWSTCTWKSNRPPLRSISQCSTSNRLPRSGPRRCPRPRPQSGGPPASSVRTPCSCTAAWA